MKQILFLLLFPCFAMAQYTGNANQKITLGEQTTADGLVYRGVASADTIRKPSIDTMAFILLDTTTNILWQYKKATNNAWTRLGGSISTGVTGVLPVANGGTNTSTLTANKVMVGNGTSGVITPTNLHWNNTNSRLGIGTAIPDMALDVIEDNEPSQANAFAIARFTGSSTVANDLSIIGPASSQVRINFGRVGRGQDGEMGYNNSSRSFRLVTAGLLTATFDSLNRVGINITGPTEKLHVVGNARITVNILAGVAAATARLHIAAGTATANTAPLKFTSGVNLTTAEVGVMEFNGTNLFFSPSTTRHTVNHGLTASATLNFPSTTTLLSADLTITVTNAADGDVVSLGVPNAAVNANTSYSAWVSAANTVTVRFNNYSSNTVDPVSGSFKVFVTK